MPGKHRDNSSRLNLERNIGTSGRYAPNDDYSLWKRDLDRFGEGRGGRPIVDKELERDADRAAMTYLRKGNRHHAPSSHFGKGPKGYQRSDDRIREDACEALYQSFEIDASEIEVDVIQGRIFLKGKVDSRQTKRLAEQTIENLAGVIDVQNELIFWK